MLADPMTKLMKPDRLLESLDKSSIDLVPTAASTIAKLMKQKQRRKTPNGDHLLNDVERNNTDDHLLYDVEYDGYTVELGADTLVEQYVDSNTGAIVHFSALDISRTPAGIPRGAAEPQLAEGGDADHRFDDSRSCPTRVTSVK